MAKKKKSSPIKLKSLIIAIIAIVLIVAIAVAVLYFAFPEAWEQIVDTLQSLSPSQDDDLSWGNGTLQVHMLDVGQGDCIYIKLPDGKDMVIDCANYNNATSYREEIFAYLKNYIVDGTIEYLMLTHCDSDHVYFMDELIYEYDVEKIFMPNVLAAPTNKDLQAEIDKLDTSRFTDEDTISSAAYAEFFIAALKEPNCEIVLNMDDNDSTTNIAIIEETYRLVFYSPTKDYYDSSKVKSAEEKNAISPVGILEYNGRKIMLTGDSNKINEPLVMARTGKIDCDVLKVGHHGSESSTSNEFLDCYTFEYAIISCNADKNTFLHPRQATLDRLASHNISVYRTDNNGNIVVTVNESGDISIAVEKECDNATNLIGYTGKEK